MRFIETPVFTKIATALWSDDEYHALQLALFFRPALGPIIPGSGGLRKVRWSRSGAGKRGGVRVIYHWHEATETFFMLYIYSKAKQGDLSAQQLRQLSRLVREELS
ncbi:MAG TPA: type II toxin-antitoxin system RelE/ParE family toxin [Gemmataceae bacterium]|jgi:mRNA-degrading endonuclease RelE of RelBE toxin-antitoxin system|nr:type II toxin-antitoxin system RelE/ParE family toxin [Gemmataceae bacterium]